MVPEKVTVIYSDSEYFVLCEYFLTKEFKGGRCQIQRLVYTVFYVQGNYALSGL